MIAKAVRAGSRVGMVRKVRQRKSGEFLAVGLAWSLIVGDGDGDAPRARWALGGRGLSMT